MSVSRYAGSAQVAPGDLNARTELAPRRIPDAAELVRVGLTWEYTTVQGERIDQIAYRTLGDSRLWWVVADLNPGVDPLDLPAGTRLVMPRLQGAG